MFKIKNYILFSLFFICITTIQAATWYSKVAQTNPNNLTNWTANSDGTGANPLNFTTPGDLFIVQAGHNYTTTAAWTVSANIQIDGTLNLDNTSSWTGTLTINGTYNTNANNRDVSGITTLTINTGGSLDLTNNNCDVACTSLVMNGISTINAGNANRTISASGSFTVNVGATATVTGGITFTIGTTSAINGAFSIGANAGIKTFTGKVTLGAAGTWSSTAVTTTANLVFGGGIQNDNVAASSFDGRGCTFSATQTLSGTGPISLSSANGDGVDIAGAFVITNNNTNLANGGVNITGLLTTSGGGSWVQGANSYLSLGNNANPITAVTTDFTAANNTVDYNRAGAQAGVLDKNYVNLVASGSGAKTFTQTAGRNITGTLTVSGAATLTVNGAFTFAVTGTTTVNSSCTLNGAANYSLGAMTLIGTFSGTSASSSIGAIALSGSLTPSGTTTTGAVTFSGASGIIAGGGTLTAASLDLSAGTGTIGAGAITISGTTTIGNTYSLTCNSNAGTKRFFGLITTVGSGSFNSTSITTSPRLELRGGVANAGTFTTNVITFTTASQNLTGAGTYAFQGAVTISGAYTITNQCSNILGVNIDGVLDGTVAGSTWKNDPSTKLFYGNATQPMNTGVLDVSANANLVEYDRGNAQAIKVPLTSYYHLSLTGGAGTQTLIVAANLNVDGNFIVASGNTFAYDDGGGTRTFAVAGATTCAGTIRHVTNTTGIISLQAVELSGGQLGNAVTGTINVAGAITLTTANGNIGRSNVTVSIAQTIPTGRTLFINSATGLKRFDGQIVTVGTGTFDANTTASTTASLELRGGVNNAGIFTVGGINFSTSSQSIQGAGTYSISGNVLITGAITVINSASNVAGITITGTLDGTVAGSTWEQDNGSILYLPNATMPFNTAGVLDAYTPAETNKVYYSGASNSVYGSGNEYYDIHFTGTGAPTLTTNTTIQGNLYLETVTLNNTVTFPTMAAGTTIHRFNTGALQNVPTFGASVNINYTLGALTTGPEMPVSTTVLNNLTIDVAGAAVTLGAAVTCNGVCTFTNGNINLATFNFTLAAAGTFAGAFDNTHMLACNSTGKLIKKGTVNAHFDMVYPVGTGTVYTPMTIAAFSGTFGGGDQITVLPVAVKPPLTVAPTPYNSLIKYWTVSTTGLSAVSCNVTFKYDDAEIFGTETNYEPRSIYGGALNTVTGPSNSFAANTFTSTGATTTDLNGDWTCIDPNPAIPQSWYSFQSGDWANPLTWTLTVGIYDNPSSLIPSQNAVDDITIKIGHTVYTNIDRTVTATVLEAGASLDLKNNTSTTLGTVSGQGTLRLNSYVFPTGTFTTFIATGGGTVEYYDVASGSLPTTQLTYCNLLLSNSTGSGIVYTMNNPFSPTTYTLNGTLTTTRTGAGALTLTLGNVTTNAINLSVAGTITNGAGCTINCGSFNAIHTITCSGDLINNGTFDVANNAAYSTATTGAAHLVFTGLTNNLLTCNGTTEVYSLTLNKGTDQTYSLTLTAPTGSFAFTTDGVSGANGIVISNGTLVLGTGTSFTQLDGTNSNQYDIVSSACLKVNGSTITYGNRNIRVYGKFWMVTGTAEFGRNGLNLMTNSEFQMDGGTLNIERMLNGGAGTTVATITITGGTINVNDSYPGAGVNDQPRFALPSPNVTWIQSGGTINIKNPVSLANCSNGGFQLLSAVGNYSVSGGTWNMYIPALSTAIDNFYINSTVPFYDLNILSDGAGTCVAKLDVIGGEVVSSTPNPLVVLNDFTIGNGSDSPTFDANGYAVTVGGNFTINTGATYNPRGNTTTLNGPQTYGRVAQTLTLNSAVVRATDLVVNKSSGTLTMAGSSNFNCLKSLTLTAGTIDDGGKTIDVSGDITNSGTHSGAGAIEVKRGVRSTTGIPAYTVNLPTITGNGGPTTHATFNLTVKNGIVTNISVATGGAGYANGYRTLTVAGGNGSNFSCGAEAAGGSLVSVWINNGGTGYGPTATEAGGALYDAVVTGVVSDVLGVGAGTLTAVNVIATGEGYSADATVNISASAPSGATTCTGVTTAAPNIGGSGSGVFTNFSLNNDVTGGGAVFTANQTVNGNLRLLNGILNINSFSLTLAGATNIYSDAAVGTTFTATKMIKTNGLSSAGGIIKTYSTTSFTFPIGSGTEYTPGTIALSGAPTAYGSITMKPVASEHPLVSASGQSLTYYWKVASSGFTLGAATVTQTYTYDQSDVVDDGLTVLETAYVPGKFDLSSIAWVPNPDNSKVDDPVNNTITFDGALYNTAIDGDYTAGDQVTTPPSDPFSIVLTYYSRDGSAYDWDDGNSWSVDNVLKHTGAAAALVPTSNSIVRIGDGVTYNHTVIVDANTQVSGSLLIANGSTLDLGTTTGHNFGIYTTPGAPATGNGTLRISSSAATAEFPAGDFTPFLGLTGGTVDYYTTGAQDFTIPATSAAPTSASLPNYYNLILTPATGQNITMPNLDIDIYNDMTVLGASATGVARLNTASTKTLDITNNLTVTTGNLQFRNGNAQTLTVGNDITVSTGAIFDLENAGATANSISLAGTITVNGTGIFDMVQSSTCALTFTGTANEKITGTGGTIELHTLTLNKGTSQTPMLDVDFAGTFTVPTTYEWLTLTNGTFRWNKAATLTISNTTTPTPFTIPGTTCLSLGASGTGINLSYFTTNQNNADVYLTGKIEVLAGTMNVGNVARNSNNDIEIDQTGSPTIDIQGAGQLFVNGAIRRRTTSASGALIYSQSGTSIVTIAGRTNGNLTRGKFEVCNPGSSFNMSGTSILEINKGGGTDPTFGDLYIAPTAASSVSSGSLIRFVRSNQNSDEVYGVNTNMTLSNLTVDGFDANDLAEVKLLINSLTLTGNLIISDDFSVFNANSFDVNIAGNLTNSNTNASTGVTVGGYRAGSSSQTTTFNSSTASQTITGTATPNLTNFGKLVVNNSFGTVSFAANTAARVASDITITTPMADGGNIISVLGNVIINSTHTGAGKIYLIGTTAQTITGSGSFTNLDINNSSGTNVAILSNSIINGTLTLTTGKLNIANYKLTFGVSAGAVAGVTSTKFIQSSGAITDGGVEKLYSDGAGTSINFTFPLGVGTYYRPATFTGTATTASSNLLVKQIQGAHPSTQDPGNTELLTYWNVTQTGMSAISVTHNYTYIDPTDVQGTEASYVAGRYDPSITDWNPNNGGAPGAITPASNLLDWTAVNFLNGDYTAGYAVEFAALAIYYSRNATLGGNWSDVNSWSTDPVLMHGGAAAASPPSGNQIYIATGHTITVDGNSKSAASIDLAGTAILDNSTYIGLNFGSITGTGTMRIAAGIATFILPTAILTSFVTSAGGTIEYYGGTSGGISGVQTTYNNLIFDGASTKTLSAVNLTINGNLTIANTVGNVVSHPSNTLTINGNWVNSLGSTGYTSAAGTISMVKASAAQTITGATIFNNLTLNNTFGTAPQFTVNADITVKSTLTMTSGIVALGGYTVTLGQSGVASTLSRAASGTTNWFENGTMLRYCLTNIPITSTSGNYYGLFPLGEPSTASSYSPFAVNSTVNPTTGGYISARLAISSGTIDLSPLYSDGGTNVERIRKQGHTVATGGGFAGGTYSIASTAVNLSAGTLSDIRLCIPTGGTTASAVGTHAAATGSAVNPTARRTAVSAANLNNTFVLASTNKTPTPLPIELLSFTAKPGNSVVNIEWTTSTEINNDYFTVEKSEDGINFEVLSTVEAAGNSTSQIDYHIVDEYPTFGISYYRLKQTDYDGKSTYSQIEVVEFNFEGIDNFNIYPNPNNGISVNVSITASLNKEILVEVYDITGKKTFSKVVVTQTEGENVYAIDFNEKLSSGVYFITATSNQSIYNKRLIVK